MFLHSKLPKPSSSASIVNGSSPDNFPSFALLNVNSKSILMPEEVGTSFFTTFVNVKGAGFVFTAFPVNVSVNLHSGFSFNLDFMQTTGPAEISHEYFALALIVSVTSLSITF